MLLYHFTGFWKLLERRRRGLRQRLGRWMMKKMASHPRMSFFSIFCAALFVWVIAPAAGAAGAGPSEEGPAALEAYERHEYAEAATLWRNAAERGDPLAQLSLGNLYFYGRGVPKQPAEAARWWRKAAEQGETLAQYALAELYATGEGVKRDDAEAAKWLREAADQGEAMAQLKLGSIYFSGRGALQDYAEAVKWWRKAAEQGEPFAHYFLGTQYVDGRGGVPLDYVQAHKWLNLATTRFSTSDQKTRDEVIGFRNALTRKMTPAQIAEAQRLAREWKPKPER
jgi:TPR repeat protein